MNNYGNDISYSADSVKLGAASSVGRRRGYAAVKRMMDVSGALLGILLFFPIGFIIAVLLKLESPGASIFFKQTRIGKDGEPFRMYKFRSMIQGAEEKLEGLLQQNEIKGAMFKMKDDPRVTRVGRWIRKTSLDELPQLWNVVRGEMSLVGPRPSLPREVAQYARRDRLRLTATPGCTGLWQVSGRNGMSFEQMVELDLYYIEHSSIWFDLKLILKTFRVILFPNDAY